MGMSATKAEKNQQQQWQTNFIYLNRLCESYVDGYWFDADDAWDGRPI